MPPIIEHTKDLLGFTKSYTKYVSDLVDGYEKASALSEEDRASLEAISQLVLDSMDDVLGRTQAAVNESLRSGDLERMRQLSTARSTMFERLQRLRGIIRPLGGDDAANPLGPDLPSSPPEEDDDEKTRAAEMDALALAAAAELDSEEKGLSSSGRRPPVRPVPSGTKSNLKAVATKPDPRVSPTRSELRAVSTDPMGSGGSSGKSELTRAAEAKDAARRDAERKAAQKPAPEVDRKRLVAIGRQHSPHGSARKDVGDQFGPGFRVAVALVVVLGVGGIAGYFAWAGGDEEEAPPPGNRPPQMKFVALDESPAGIIARPQALDPENERITYRLRWYVDDELVHGETGARLKPEIYEPGSKVEVEVTPEDPHVAGQPMLSQPHFAKSSNPRAQASAAERVAEPADDNTDEIVQETIDEIEETPVEGDEAESAEESIAEEEAQLDEELEADSPDVERESESAETEE